MKQLAEQQAEDRKVIMELVQSQGRAVVTNCIHHQQNMIILKVQYFQYSVTVTDPKIVMEQFNWLLKDIQSGIKLLEGKISVKDNVNTIYIKDSVKSSPTC